MGNRMDVTAFILLGLTSDPDLQVPLFVTFLLIYTITVAGILGMVLLILLDSRLHTTMYFFLGNLSLVDFCYSSAVTPTVMTGLCTGDEVISCHACVAQMFFATGFATVDDYLLTSMAYDRYVAVRKPPHYTATMTTRVCACLVTGCYVCGFLSSSTYTGNTYSLCYCESNVTHHFFCDIPVVVALSCSNKHGNDLLLIYAATFNVFFALLLILASYADSCHSPEDALRGSTREGSFHLRLPPHRRLHLLRDGHFHVPAAQLLPLHGHGQIASVFCTVVAPMLHPLVYSLRSREGKEHSQSFL